MKDEQGIHPLSQSCPPFLSLLDSNPSRAKDDFSDFFHRFFAAFRPAAIRGLPPEDQDDVLQGFWVACCKDDFRRLRKYRNRGGPFAAWFQIVARNWAIGWRRRREIEMANTIPLDPEAREPAPSRKNPGRSPDEDLDRSTVLEKVNRCLGRLDEYSRLLIDCAIDGLKPRQIVELLKIPRDRNKAVSDTLRAIRGRLRRCLEREEVDINSYLGRRCPDAG